MEPSTMSICSQTLRYAALLLLAVLLVPDALADEDGFESIFDGKTLKNWDGNPKFWSVEDGAITGQTTKENPTKGNTFIIYQGDDLGDFELKLEYRIVGGNSGIQYRSFVADKDNWVVGGYQADFEAGDNWSGANYGEKFRGVLAKRGQKTVIGANHKPKVVGEIGDSNELQKHIKKEDWNEHHVTAKDFNFVHKINGVLMSEMTDEDKEQRRATGILALQLHAGPPMKVQFRNIRLKRTGGDKGDPGATGKAGDKKKVVFVSGRPSHGYGSHEHYAGCLLLAKELEKTLGYDCPVVKHGYPKDTSVFDGADAVVVYCDGGGGHLLNRKLEEFDELMKKGVGLGCIHYGVETTKGPAGDKFLDWIGGYFEPHWSVNPHWTAEYKKFPDHPVTRGVKPFAIQDEWYYHMRFREGMKGVTPILSALPPAETLRRGDGAHSGNPDVRKAVAAGEPQHMMWVAERPDGGRGFGFTGGHFHWNWGDDNFRKVVLNGIVWIAKGETPAKGVTTETPTREDLEANQDEPGPKKKAPKQSTKVDASKAAFASKVITKQTPGHAVEIDVDITGAKQLYLIANDGGNGYSCDWCDWAEPRLVGATNEKKLTELKWKSASTDHGSVNIGKNAGGRPLRIAGRSVEYGVGTHANSVIVYDLPPGYTRFKARGGLDNGGTDQGACGDDASVQFLVYTQRPPVQVIAVANKPAGGASRDPADAVDNLDAAEGTEAMLFASEPMTHSISNIDVDARGRVWVCEIVNYRGKGKRAEGDRILILEDTDGDAKADKSTVFHQGRDIDSPHGVCVLASPDGKSQRVIVSAGDKVQVFTDSDGDDKPDSQEVLFSGISGAQHDHGIHAFVFGPDGKLYFNFGNNGRQIKDKDGKPIVDQAGNEIAAKRKPYQEGMVFRCNLDGSEMETLGWNFRNNWMATVDSFGTIWQSDNDDDGNKGVRINFVMEFGNYGYKDEFTGAGWKDKRSGMSDLVPERHWHLNDPGVVPNLLLTGQGSPTGITVYEGTLLPKVFQNQVIHCDAGPSVCRAYPVTNEGAGYKAETVNVLYGARDNWYRPSDVSVAPDGSLLIADWYDPGVGGHNARDLESGRIFRVAPPGGKYTAPKFDFATIDGAIEALKNPNYAVRYTAWTALNQQGAKAEPALEKVFRTDANPRYRARALWLLTKIDGRGEHWAAEAIKDKDSDIRIVGLRAARQLKLDVVPFVQKLVKDESPQVRRECAIALRGVESTPAAELWAELASQYDGRDRWQLEALGIGAAGQWDAFLDAWLSKVGGKWNTPAGREIIWRSRAKATPGYLAEIILDPATPKEDHPKLFRSFDFLSGPEKDAALQKILGL
jgi:putative membrane-bound dehydrogenase-like protein